MTDLRVRLTAPQEKVLRTLVDRASDARPALRTEAIAEAVYGSEERAHNATRVLYKLAEFGLARQVGLYHWSATQAGRWFVENLPDA